MSFQNNMFRPGAILHEVIAGAFRAKGSNLQEWVKANGVSTATVRNVTFGQSAGPRSQALLDRLRRAFELVGDETAYAGAMQAEYEGVAGTTGAKLVVFRSHLNRLAVGLTPILELLNELTAALQPYLLGLTEWMQANPELIKTIALVGAGLFAMKAAFLGVRLLFQPLIGAFWMFNGVLAGGSWAIGAATTVLGVLAKALSIVRFAILAIGRVMLANRTGRRRHRRRSLSDLSELGSHRALVPPAVG